MGLTQQNSLFGAATPHGESEGGERRTSTDQTYLLAKPCNIHTLLDDLAIVYAKLLPSGASV
jgi:hypothetical protein